MDAIYISSNSFKVLSDRTTEFNTGRRVKMDCGLNGIKYASVVSSSYSDPYTTVQIDESSLTAALADAWYGVTQTGLIGSFPDHTHNDGEEGQGGVLDGLGLGLTFLSFSDTPSTYSGTEGQYLMSTGSGTVWATVSGVGGTTSGIDDHSHAAYVPWDFGAGTISGTGDIYCNDIYTSSGTVWIGDVQLTTSGSLLLVDGQVYTDGAPGPPGASGTNGLDGAAGADGADGADGATWITASGTPAQETGNYVDYYLDLITYNIYRKDVPAYGVTNLFTGGTPSVSSINSGNAARVVDGFTATDWLSNGAPAWFKYDLGSGNDAAISKLRIYPRNDGGNRNIKNYEIYGSTNNSDWDLLHSDTFPNGAASWEDIEFSNSTSYRYIRLDILNTYTNYPGINEAEAYDATGFDWGIIGNIKGADGADGADAPTTFSGLTDTPVDYGIEGSYLRTTTSGITTASGIILEAPNGSDWLLQVTNSGTLYTTEVV